MLLLGFRSSWQEGGIRLSSMVCPLTGPLLAVFPTSAICPALGHCQPGELFFFGSAIFRVDEERDLRVVITADLKSSAQYIAAEQKAQKVLGYNIIK